MSNETELREIAEMLRESAAALGVSMEGNAAFLERIADGLSAARPLGDECSLWDDVSRFIREGNAALTQSKAIEPSKDEVVEDFLHELDGWESAYPLSAFPEPDLNRAAELLKAGGMTLDAISASNMRHVVSRIAPKARAAIAALSTASKEGSHGT